MASSLLLRARPHVNDAAYSEALDEPCEGYLGDSQFVNTENMTSVHEKRGGVETFDHAGFTYAEFVQRYMKLNTPVVIRGLGSAWRAWKDWRNSGCEGSGVAWDRLVSLFGPSTVQASSVSVGTGDCHSCQVTVTQFCQQRSTGACYKDMDCKEHPSAPYVKDWHLAAEFPQYHAYSCPAYFADDWLNTFLLDNSGPVRGPNAAADPQPATHQSNLQTADYRFVYLGLQGSRTLLHADVVRSFSWSINISGKKRWLLLPPEYTHLAMDPAKLNLSPSLECEEVSDWQQRFPRLHEARQEAIEVIQNSGEALFVPSGWTHSVENLEDTMSINHNWLNGFNVMWSANLLCQTFTRAVQLICDCREGCESVAEFLSLADRMVLADSAFSFQSFTSLLVFVIRSSTAELSACGGPNREGTCYRAQFNTQRATWAMQRILSCLADVWQQEMSLSGQHACNVTASADDQLPLSQQLLFPDLMRWLESVTLAADHEQWMWVMPVLEHLRNAQAFLTDCGLAALAKGL
eukprot:jgi/Ulvmu1/2986/UM015_0026.1